MGDKVQIDPGTSNNGKSNPGTSNNGKSNPGTQTQPSILTKSHIVNGVYLDNPAAKTDVLKGKNMFAGAHDRQFITISADGKLGIKPNLNPEDPFRWEKFIDILKFGNVSIQGISELFDSFIVKEVIGNQIKQPPPRHLRDFTDAGFAATGVTLLPDSMQQTTDFVGSNSSRAQIYYGRTPGTGFSLQGINSLAHELFGHFWLALKGVPFRHGDMLTAAHNILDPLGFIFVGSVNAYINLFIASKGDMNNTFVLNSPTQRLSQSHYNAAIQWILKNGKAKLIQGKKTNEFLADFRMNWEILSRHYSVLKINQGPGSKYSIGYANAVLEIVLKWFNSLPNSEQKLFQKFLSQVLSKTNRSTRLADDFLFMLKNTPSQLTPQNIKGKPNPSK